MIQFFAKPSSCSRSFLNHSLRCMPVLSFLMLAVLCLQSLSAKPPKAEVIDRPNVVVILTDDQGWGDLSLHGNPNLSTPNLDAMAKEGAQIEHFYVCPVCSPTRAEFLTGRYHSRMGVHSTSTGGERFNSDEQTIADVFRNAGYATAAYGKWHSGMQFPYHPNSRGFDDFYGFCSGHWGNYYWPMLEHNGRIVTGEGFIVDDLTNHAIDFIDQHREESFFVYLPYNTPHSPMQVPDPFWEKFKDKQITPDPVPVNARKQDLTHTRAALAMCENIDKNVGRLLDHLKEIGLDQNTIVVYFSDNGPNGSRFNGGLRGHKGSTHEGGVRSPCLIRYPQEIHAGTTVKHVGASIDLLPTLADLAGIELTSPKPLDGRSLAPLLKQVSSPWMDRMLFSTWNNRVTVRTDQFRKHFGGNLYDISVDPGETKDVSEQHPEIAGKLETAMQTWIEEVQPKSSNDPETRPITLAHPNAVYTQLPARDAKSHGNLKRSSRHPNCTFFSNWISRDDKITWDVDVLGAGEYEVELYYACPKSSVGSKLELSLMGERIEASIGVANPVPRMGMEHDRFKRIEGYVKAWRSMTLGVMELKPGKGTLTLRASAIEGDEVGDMRLLMFRRVAK